MINIRKLLTPPAIYKYGVVMILIMYANINMASPPSPHAQAEENTPPPI